MTHLCAAPHCHTHNRHLPTCTTPCAGCQPQQAADGLRLCHHHTRRLAHDATQAAHLHTELQHQLTHTARPGEHTTGTPDRSTTLNDRAVTTRTDIRAVLVAWTQMIADERGIHPPADNIGAIGGYLARHATWLAAHPAAGDAAAELHHLVHTAWPIAYPTGARVFPVAPCPEPGCPGTLKAILRTTDSLLPSALACDTGPEHVIPADRWLTLGRTLNRQQETRL